MPEVAELLRTEFREAVDALAPSDRLDGLVRRRVARARARRRRAQRAAVTALVVAALAPLAWRGLGVGGGRGDVEAGPPAATGGGVLYLVPTTVPDGLTLLGVRGPGSGRVPAGPRTGWDRTERFVRFDAAGERPQEIVDVQARAVPPGAADPLEPVRAGATPTTVRGAEAVESAGEGWLAWADPRGDVLRVGRPGAGPGAADEVAALHALAEGLQLPSGSPLDLDGAVLPGFTRIGGWPDAPRGGEHARELAYRATDGRSLLLQIVDGSERSPAMLLGSEDARVVTVRGQRAVLTPDAAAAVLPSPGGNDDPGPDLAPPDLAVQWDEPGGAQVTLSGAGLGESQLLAVADGLRPVDAATWLALDPRLSPPSSASPPATASAPATTLPAPPATPPPTAAIPGATTVAGTYHGTERYALTSGRCPDLDQVLDETLTLADGTLWRLHQDYCGDLGGTGDRYRGNGTFTLTTPSGDTLTGTFAVDWTPAPSDGVPYALEISGGTGAYAGARGSCTLDEHITRIVLGVQDHDGTFVCRISPP